MTYLVMINAARKAGISHEEFKNRYELHIQKVAELSGDAVFLKHTRRYPKHEGDAPAILAGRADAMYYDVIAEMEFEDKAAWGRFCQAVAAEDVAAWIEKDEADFWDRERMNVVVLGEVKVWEK